MVRPGDARHTGKLFWPARLGQTPGRLARAPQANSACPILPSKTGCLSPATQAGLGEQSWPAGLRQGVLARFAEAALARKACPRPDSRRSRASGSRTNVMSAWLGRQMLKRRFGHFSPRSTIELSTPNRLLLGATKKALKTFVSSVECWKVAHQSTKTQDTDNH